MVIFTVTESGGKVNVMIQIGLIMGNTACRIWVVDLKVNRQVESRYVVCKFPLCLSRQTSNQEKHEGNKSATTGRAGFI